MATTPTDDRRLHVFVSANPEELAADRAAATQAIRDLRLVPVTIDLDPGTHAPRDLCRSYVAQSDVFVGVYGAAYGPRAPETGRSRIEDEYDVAGRLPRLLYIKDPAAAREPGLESLIERFMADAGASFTFYRTPEELGTLVRDDLAVMLTERFDGPAPVASITGSTPPGEQEAVPLTVNAFVGRGAELAEVSDLVRDPAIRLVTLTGPGGIGKSRLALELAHLLEGEFPDGVHVVLLETVEDPDAVLPAVARVLGLSTVGVDSPLGAIVGYAVKRRLLLVLDNVEQVLPVGPVLADLLGQAPGVTMLVTSRAPLQLRGEHEYQLPPLAVPTGQGQEVAAFDAVQLFVERARAANPSFSLDDGNADAVAEITRRLDGLPLALELAAARSRVLPPGALVDRLADRFGVLRGHLSDSPARHQTLWDTIAWSYDLLDDDVKRCFGELGVFSGGWTLEAAGAVCTRPDAEALDVLASLVNASLVQPLPRSGAPRFTMLQSVRDFAVSQLAAAGDEVATRSRHAGHFLGMAEAAGPALRGSEQITWLDRLDDDADNVMSALRWAAGHDASDRAAEACGGLWLWWWLRSRTAAADQLLTFVTGRDLSPHARAVGLAVHASMAWWQAKPSEALGFLKAAIPLFDEPEDATWRAFCIGLRGLCQEMLGDQQAAMADLDAAVALAREIGDSLTEAVALNAMGWTGNLLGVEVSPKVYDEAVEAARRSGATTIIAMAMTTRAHHDLLAGRVSEARARFTEGLELLARHRVPTSLANGLDAVATFAVTEGDPRLAARLLGGAERVREVHAQPPMLTIVASRGMVLADVQKVLDGDTIDAEWQTGRQMTLEELVDEAQRWLSRAP